MDIYAIIYKIIIYFILKNYLGRSNRVAHYTRQLFQVGVRPARNEETSRKTDFELQQKNCEKFREREADRSHDSDAASSAVFIPSD